jgi:hypothetical protein
MGFVSLSRSLRCLVAAPNLVASAVSVYSGWHHSAAAPQMTQTRTAEETPRQQLYCCVTQLSHKQREYYFVATALLSVTELLPSCFLATALVYLLFSLSLPSSGCIHHIVHVFPNIFTLCIPPAPRNPIAVKGLASVWCVFLPQPVVVTRFEDDDS